MTELLEMSLFLPAIFKPICYVYPDLETWSSNRWYYVLRVFKHEALINNMATVTILLIFHLKTMFSWISFFFFFFCSKWKLTHIDKFTASYVKQLLIFVS